MPNARASLTDVKIAITGAKGRLGRELRRYFEGLGCDVTGFSRNADAEHQPLGTFGQLLERERFDAVLHLAWSTVPSTAEVNPGVEWREDLPLLSALLRELDLRRTGSEHAPLFLFFSSCAVYGEAPHSGQVFDETCATRPIGWYARGKVQAEELIGAFAARGNPAAVLRVTNPYGFVQEARYLQGVIPALVRAAVQGGEFTMWGGDDAVKDYLHISDLCRAVECIVRSDLRGTFNVSAGRSVSLRDLVGMVESVTGRPVKCCASPAAPWDVRSGRYSHQALNAATGWQPSVDLADGLPGLVRLVEEVPT
jgi:UDP-glucose 4-epimerase